MTQEEIVRLLQGAQQRLNALMATEKEAEIKAHDAHEARLQTEGEVGVWEALLQQTMKQAAEAKTAEAKTAEAKTAQKEQVTSG